MTFVACQQGWTPTHLIKLSVEQESGALYLEVQWNYYARFIAGGSRSTNWNAMICYISLSLSWWWGTSGPIYSDLFDIWFGPSFKCQCILIVPLQALVKSTTTVPLLKQSFWQKVSDNKTLHKRLSLCVTCFLRVGYTDKNDHVAFVVHQIIVKPKLPIQRFKQRKCLLGYYV